MSRQASGLRAWALQRISAAYLGLYIIYLIGLFLFAPPSDVVAWRGWIADPVHGVGLLLFFVALLIHAWVGFRDVLIDYVQPFLTRVSLLTLLGIGLIGCGLWAARVIFLTSVPI